MARKESFDKALELLKAGHYVKDISEATGYPISSVYAIARREGIKINKVEPQRGKRPKTLAVVEYVMTGHTFREAAELFGLTRETVKGYCRDSEEYKARSHERKEASYNDRLANAISLIETNNPSFEYVEGFKNCDSTVVIRCKLCGTETVRAMVTVRRKKLSCQTCAKEKRRIREEQRHNAEKIEKHKREVRKINAGAVQLFLNFCECGGVLEGRKTRCQECSDNLARRRRNVKRDKRRKRAFTKETCTISLEKLYERDNGICWICGEACDMTKHRNDNEYPSIDHILPISLGGKDTWQNIRLAHRICNSVRGNRVAL